MYCTVEPPLTATSLQRPLFFVPADGPYIHSYFNLSAMVTPPQRKRPLKRVRKSLHNVTSLQNDQLQNNGVYQTPGYIVKGYET